LLPSHIELLAVQLPGREARLSERPYDRAGPLVTALADALQGVTEQPYALFGHSMGALLAFEFARELRRRGCALPRTLIGSARRAPTVPQTEPPLHRLPDERFVAEIMRRYGGIPSAILTEPELMALFLPVLKADFAVFETYEYCVEPSLDCALAIYGGRDDPQTPQMAGWAPLVTGPVRLRIFDGGHFYTGEQRQALADALTQDLSLPAYAG
jgi:medium-chain acyl-[acyl-carrier-protein] hydrolase